MTRFQIALMIKLNSCSVILWFVCHVWAVSGFVSRNAPLSQTWNLLRVPISCSSLSDPTDASEDPSKVIRPLPGGPSLIFAMAQRLNLWEDMVNDSSNSTNLASPYAASTLPRYRKSSQQGISNVNPNFRTAPPVMNKKGYASTILRNARKKNKPGLWRYSLRTYHKLRSIELLSGNEEVSQTGSSDCSSSGTSSDGDRSSSTSTSSNATTMSSLSIYRENAHFQGVMVAVAKLGLWQEAIQIYHELQDLMHVRMDQVGDSYSYNISATMRKRRKALKIDNGILVSLVDACVHGMKLSHSREPLDQALNIVLSMKDRHNITPSHIHMNKLASGYQYLGLHEESNDILNQLIDMESDFDSHESTVVDYVDMSGGGNNIRNSSSSSTSSITRRKASTNPMHFDRMILPSSTSLGLNEASYKILVQNAIREGDWAQCIQNLRSMTEEGIFPRSRTLNAWSEVASKRERRPKKKKWVKKRERLLFKGLELQRRPT